MTAAESPILADVMRRPVIRMIETVEPAKKVQVLHLVLAKVKILMQSHGVSMVC